jgi:hypothetical protein
MQEWKISFCFQEPDHKKHKEPDTETLQNKVHIRLKEKIVFMRAAIIKLFCEKHEPEEESICGIIKEFPVLTLEKVSNREKNHH